MKTELKPYTFNAKKWRIENGYTTPEWEMYVANTLFTMQYCIVAGILFGVVLMSIAMS